MGLQIKLQRCTWMAIALSLALLPATTVASGWIEGGLFGEYKTEGLDPSFGQYLSGSWSDAGQRTWYGELQHARRFGENDLQWMAGVYQPVFDAGQIHLNGTYSPTARIQPDYSLYAGFYLVPRQAWGLEPGYRLFRDDGQSSHALSLMIEHYWRNWRFALKPGLTWLENETANLEWGLNLSAQATRYYRERSWIGGSVFTGRELERFETSVISSDATSVALEGLHSLHTRWAFHWRLSTTWQGGAYQNYGWLAGLRAHVF